MLKRQGGPQIESVSPGAAIPGGDIFIRGRGFQINDGAQPVVRFGDARGNLLLWSEQLLVTRVPEDAGSSILIETPSGSSEAVPLALGRVIAEDLHPVANPAVDDEGNIYVTFSGQRGQKVPVSLYKVTADGTAKPLTVQLTNPTGLAVDRSGALFVSCRNDGTIHRIGPSGRAQKWVEGMGIATGLAFDHEGNLYVGDRSGTIFKISPQREILVFATLEPSIAAYHLAFNPAGELFVSGPTTSSFDRVYRINHAGEVDTFFRGLGRPQGMAFDGQGNLLIAASLGGRRGIVRLTPDAQAELVLSGLNLVGLALLSHRAILATNSSLFAVQWDIDGLPLGG